MAIRVVTDSASSLTADELARLGIVEVPLHVYVDGVEVDRADAADPSFYDRLLSLGGIATTSQPSPPEFASVFTTIAEQGDDVLAVLISGGMSGTVESAEAAAASVSSKFPECRIVVVDSRSNSLEEGFAVVSAARVAQAGGSLSECRKAAEDTMARTRFLFTPHSLEHLRRGGRISGASALASSLLRIVPVLTADQGSTGVAGVARTGRSANAKIASLMRRDIEKCGLSRVAVQYISDLDGARRFAAEVVAPVASAPVQVTPLSVVVGIHVGPAIGVVYETVKPLR